MHHVAPAEARGIEPPRRAPPVVAEALGVIGRPWALVNAAQRAVGHGGEAAQHVAGRLDIDQIGFAGDRQAGKRRAVGHAVRIDVRQQVPEIGGIGLGVGDLHAQGLEQGILAGVRGPGFLVVVMRVVGHRAPLVVGFTQMRRRNPFRIARDLRQSQRLRRR